MTHSGFVALAGRPERGQVDARQRRRRGEGRDRLRPAADHAPGDPRACAPASDGQIVLVDLPGVQRPRDALTARMAGRVQQEARRGGRCAC